MKLTYAIQMYKSVFHIKNSMNKNNFPCTGSHKRFGIHYRPCLHMAKRAFSVTLHIFIKFHSILKHFVTCVDFLDNMHRYYKRMECITFN